MPDDRDDDALMAAMAGGDAVAFRCLVERWAPRIEAFAGRALGRRADAEDIVQETFVRVYRSAARYEPNGRFGAWIFRIAGNLVRQELRRRRVRGWLAGSPGVSDESILASLPAPPHYDADSPLRATETRAALARALARLPDRQRLAILLRHFESLPLRDIATALDISEHAAESLVARGMRTLRKFLATPR